MDVVIDQNHIFDYLENPESVKVIKQKYFLPSHDNVIVLNILISLNLWKLDHNQLL